MKKYFFFLISVLFFAACDQANRPNGGTGTGFSFKIEGTTILKNADVKIIDDSNTQIKKGTTDENGAFLLEGIETATNLTVKVCEGSFYSESVKKDVAFSGCLENAIKKAETDVNINVDFLTTFLNNYTGDTSDWLNYLDVKELVESKNQSSLTDASRLYLIQQGMALLAKKISDDGSDIAPETSLSTEKLFFLFLDDLKDDQKINGSLETKFGADQEVNGDFFRQIAEYIVDVSDFSEKDLSTWIDHLKNEPADFLGESNTDENSIIEISITIETKDGSKPDLYYGKLTVSATAEDTRGKDISYLNCYLNNETEDGEIFDTDTTKAGFSGKIDTTVMEDDSTHTVLCKSGNSKESKAVSLDFTVNNSVPEITASVYKTQTTIATGTKEEPARGTIDLVATATGKRTITDLSCNLNNDELIDSNTNNADSFSSSIDTTQYPDGVNVVKCTASDQAGENSITFEIYIENIISVTIKPFITYPLKQVNKITITDAKGNKVKDIAPDEHDMLTVNLAPGDYFFTSQGGKYQSITLSKDENDLKTFTGTLESRATIALEEIPVVVMTPLTTLRERLYRSIDANGSSTRNSTSESLSLLNDHFNKTDFDIYAAPANNEAQDLPTLNFIALASLEKLAEEIATRELGLTAGEITIENVMTALRQDLTSDEVLDGNEGAVFIGLSGNDFPVDSYLFRMYLAIALRNFLPSDLNPTGLTGLQTMIDAIALDTSMLFPAADAPIAVGQKALELSDLKFQVYWEPETEEEPPVPAELQDAEVYNSETDIIPVFNKTFRLSFTVSPDTHQRIDIAKTAIIPASADEFTASLISTTGDDPTSAVEYTYDITFKDEATYLNAEDGERTFTIHTEDIAGTVGETTVRAIVDKTAPVYTVTVPDHAVQPADSTWSWDVSNPTPDHTLRVTYLVFTPSGASCVIDWQSSSNFTTSRDLVECYENIGNQEGEYIVKTRVLDKAGNKTEKEHTITIDVTAPETLNLQLTAGDKVIQNNEIIKEQSLDIEVRNDDVATASFMVTCELTTYLQQTTFSDTMIVTVGSLPHNTNTGNCTATVWGRDAAGNERVEYVSWKIDNLAPSLTNFTLSESETYGYIQIDTVTCDDNVAGCVRVSVNNIDCQKKNTKEFECLISKNGRNNYTFKAWDSLNNEATAIVRSYSLELDEPEPSNLAINRRYLYGNEEVIPTWDLVADRSHVCTVTQKTGSGSESFDCFRNSSFILSNTGEYEIKLITLNDINDKTVTEIKKIGNLKKVDLFITASQVHDKENDIYIEENNLIPSAKFTADLNIDTKNQSKITSIRLELTGYYENGVPKIKSEEVYRSTPDTFEINDTISSWTNISGGQYNNLNVFIELNGRTEIVETFDALVRWQKHSEKNYITSYSLFSEHCNYGYNGIDKFKIDYKVAKWVDPSYLDINIFDRWVNSVCPNGVDNSYLWHALPSLISPIYQGDCTHNVGNDEGYCIFTVTKKKYQQNKVASCVNNNHCSHYTFPMSCNDLNMQCNSNNKCEYVDHSFGAYFISDGARTLLTIDGANIVDQEIPGQFTLSSSDCPEMSL